MGNGLKVSRIKKDARIGKDEGVIFFKIFAASLKKTNVNFI